MVLTLMVCIITNQLAASKAILFCLCSKRRLRLRNWVQYAILISTAKKNYYKYIGIVDKRVIFPSTPTCRNNANFVPLHDLN